MTRLVIAALAAGVLFFGWPITMNRSGLSATAQMFAYGSMAFVIALGAILMAPGTWSEFKGNPLRLGFSAATLNMFGIIAFTYMLARATKAEAPRMILVVIVVQTALTGAWGAYQAGTFDLKLVMGIGSALATVLLLGSGR